MSATASKYPEIYRSLLDEEMWIFIEQTLLACPPELATEPFEVQRQAYEKLCRQFSLDPPSNVRVTDILASVEKEVVQCRLYQQMDEERVAESDAVVLYIHGGGFVYGSLDSHDSICADICDKTNLRVVSVEYRLSPEHLHPAAFEDALIAFRWATNHFETPIILCGDSAGANLAAAVSHYARQEKQQPLGQVLIYPGLGGDTTEGSYQQHAEAPLLSLQEVHYFETVRLAELPEFRDATLAPLHDDDYSNLPPTIAFAAECDPLCDDASVYCQAVRGAGGNAVELIESGLVHGYLRARHTSTKAQASFTRITDSINAIATGDWPTNNDNSKHVTDALANAEMLPSTDTIT